MDPPPGYEDSIDLFGTSSAESALMPTVQKVKVGQLPYGHPEPGKSYPQYEGFTLWIVEEFDAPLDLDTDPIWTYSDGGLTEGQVRFVKEGILFRDGKMMVEV